MILNKLLMNFDSFSRLNKYSFETKEHGILNLLDTLNIINLICLSDVFMIYTDLSNQNKQSNIIWE